MERKTSVRMLAAVLVMSLLTWVSVLCLSGCGSGAVAEPDNVSVLYVMSESYGVNYYLSRDNYELLGWDVTLAALADTVPACPPYANQLGVPPVTTDVLVADVDDVSEYDCLVFGSSSAFVLPDPFSDLMADSTSLKLVRDAVEGGAPVFAPCAAVRVLGAAGLLDGRRVVGTPKYQEELEAAGATFLGNDHPPVTDGNLITGVRGMYYAEANAEAIAVALEGRGERGPHRRGDGSFSPESGVFSAAPDTGVVWARTYGGTWADGARDVCRADDGGFVIAGYTFSHGTGDADVLVVKVGDQGEPEWWHVAGGAGTEYGLSCVAVDGGYVVAGFTTSWGAGGRDVYLLKLDEAGNEVWSKTYGGEATDVASCVCAAEGGYLVAGYTESFGAGETDAYLIKVDADGDEVWSRWYGGERPESANCVWTSDDGGIFLSGITGTYGGGNTDAYLVRTDADGEPLWERPFGTHGAFGHGFDWCTDGAPTGDGGAVLTGYSDCQDLMDVYLARIDSSGEEMWNTAFGPTIFYDYGTGVLQRSGGGFAVCGATKSFNDSADNQLYVVETDEAGAVEREIVIGGVGPDWASAICETDDGYVVVGHTGSYGAGGFDACLVKIGRE